MKLDLLLINSSGGLLCIDAKKTYTDQGSLKVFFTLSELKRLTKLQKQQLQKALSPVCIDVTYFDDCFFIPCNN